MRYALQAHDGSVSFCFRSLPDLESMSVNGEGTIIEWQGQLPDRRPGDRLLLDGKSIVVDMAHRATLASNEEDEAEIAAEMRAMAVERIQARNPGFNPGTKK